MSNRTQISKSLYDAMVEYIRCHYDPADRDRFNWICNGIRLKEQNSIRHNLFTAYKTEKDPETAEILRQAYLDQSGIPSSYRWDHQCDETMHNGADI